MNIIKIKEIEDCFDGSFIKEVLFDEAVTEDFMHYIGQTGELEYFPNFARPFYKIHAPGKYILKGVIGNQTARIILYRHNIQQCEQSFAEQVINFNTPITAK
ncbi:MAG: hypothetical protein JW936_01355 [Sedimentisphaerales bacterium]|nr:hypothetical protein [Sedimentisphaerales bacterium]